MGEFENRLTDEECYAFFATLFPRGLQDPHLVETLAPTGWERSSWVRIAHPTHEMVLAERIAFHENIERLSKRREQPAKPPPTLEDVLSDWYESPIKPLEECGRLLGYALWDIFSDNHDVIHADGRLIDIGSFRGAASFISELYDEGNPDPSQDPVTRAMNCDCMDFYMGSAFVANRADFTSLYEFIFHLLKEQGCSWRYEFPRLHLIRFDRDIADEDHASYSPSDSFAAAKKSDEDRAAHDRMQQELEKQAEETKQQLSRSPPSTVVAYRNVYLKDPIDWGI